MAISIAAAAQWSKKGKKTKMMIIIKMRSWILPDKHSFFFLLRVIKDV